MPDALYTTREGDTVDLVCFRHYGHTVGIVETVLAANPGLAALGAILPKGSEFTLPDLAAPEEKASVNTGTVRLWD